MNIKSLRYKIEHEEEIGFLRKEFFCLHEEWEYILDIFGKDKNIKLIYEELPGSVGNLFQYIQHALLSSVTHRVSRLLDPAKQGKNENLSLEWFRDSLDCEQRDSNEELWKLIKEDGKKIKKLRRKVLAHNDFKMAGNTDGLTWSNRSVDRIITNINKYFIDTINEDYLGSFTRDEQGVDTLIELLKKI